MIDQRELARHLVANLIGRDIRTPIYDGNFGTRDVDKECGYPDVIVLEDYAKMYERNDIAARVVDLEPDECWKQYPEVYETEEERETKFEKAVDKIIRDTRLYSYLHRVDKVSGVMQYGVIFLGFDDGLEPKEPAPGFSDNAPLDTRGDAKLLYTRVMDQASAYISKWETDRTNPRYGQPLTYNLLFGEDVGTGPMQGTAPASESVEVHWSRVIHVADNLTTSEIYGQPRMQNVYNRLLGLRKIHGGAEEMFWKGGYPGLSFEVDPKHGEFTEDEKDALKQEARDYAEGFQRYLTTVGISVKSLAPQISSPREVIEASVKAICTTKRVPYRIFVGSESGEKSGTNESETWAERVAFRREMYVTPYIIRPVIDRLIQTGALPRPKADGEYTIKWTPLARLTEVERAQVGKDLTEALARYSTGGCEALIPLPEFLGKFLGFSLQQVEAIVKASPTELSVVLQQLAAGMEAGSTGTTGGNVPTSIPKMANTKDPTKTPVNKVQPAKVKKTAPTSTPTPVANTLTVDEIERLVTKIVTASKEPTVYRSPFAEDRTARIAKKKLAKLEKQQQEQVLSVNESLAKLVTKEKPEPVNVTINMPQGPAPEVTVNIPESPVPEVTVNNVVNTPEVTVTNSVATPEVNVIVPTPDVTVNVNPEITVKPTPAKVMRDTEGRITGIKPEGDN